MVRLRWIAISDEIDAIEAAQRITKNRERAARIVREVMDTVDTEDFESIQVSIKQYEVAADLLDEAVKLSSDSLQPRLERFENPQAGRRWISVHLCNAGSAMRSSGRGGTENQMRICCAVESKRDCWRNRWLRLSLRDMEFHLRNTTIAYQHPRQYWELQQIHVALGDYRGARTALLMMMDQYGPKLSARDRRAAESRIRLYAQKMIDAEG